MARELDLAKLGTIGVDATRIKANASRHKAMIYARMQTAQLELKAQIQAVVQTRSRKMNLNWSALPKLPASKNAWRLLQRPKPAWRNAKI